jgi:NADH:ubiquinone oxidoreductase subunit E|tara:strand:+ start:1066 stop:1320 length:255 start_codon:yes stop_codon:yes gene_type:complete
MPKSRHRKTQKQRSKNRTNNIKALIKKQEQQQREQLMKLMEDAQKQRDANSTVPSIDTGEQIAQPVTQQTSTPEGKVYGVSPLD